MGVELGGAGEGSVREELSDAVCELGADAGAAEEGGGYGHAGEGARGEGGEEGFGWGFGDGDLGHVKEAAREVGYVEGEGVRDGGDGWFDSGEGGVAAGLCEDGDGLPCWCSHGGGPVVATAGCSRCERNGNAG